MTYKLIKSSVTWLTPQWTPLSQGCGFHLSPSEGQYLNLWICQDRGVCHSHLGGWCLNQWMFWVRTTIHSFLTQEVGIWHTPLVTYFYSIASWKGYINISEFFEPWVRFLPFSFKGSTFESLNTISFKWHDLFHWISVWICESLKLRFILTSSLSREQQLNEGILWVITDIQCCLFHWIKI